MNALFWLSVTLFALVPVAAAAFRARETARWLWLGVCAASAIQTALGVAELVSGKAVAVWRLPGMAPFGAWSFAIDALAGWLFAVLGVIGVAASFYVAGRGRHRAGRGSITASVVAVQFVFTSFLLTAQNALPMLIAWEGMSLCAYAYILTDHGMRRARHAAYQTLAVSEAGFLLLVMAVVAVAVPAHSGLGFDALRRTLGHAPEYIRMIVFFLGFFGFGVKSGVLPLQLWMPRAYDTTPPHLAAILGGGLLNLGLFGILRVYGWVGSLPVGAGLFVVAIGAAAVFLGALYALIELRVRMILAFSSVENMGFILIGLGLAMAFMRTGLPLFAGVALTAMVIQATSHGLAKALAFLCIGEVSERTGKQDIDSLGGLWRAMPAAGAGLLVASLTLSAAAPFSGFVSEWLTLQSMLQAYRSLSASGQVVIVFSGMLTAVGAAMAFSAFLRLFSFLFTGRSRSPNMQMESHARPTVRSVSIVLLAVVSALYGFFPTAVIGGLERVVSMLPPRVNPWIDVVPAVFHNPVGNPVLTALGGRLFSFLPMPGAVVEPGTAVSSIAPTYVFWWFVFIAAVMYAVRRVLRRTPYGSRRVRAWAGGAVAFVPEFQYTATAFANPQRMFFSSFLRFSPERKVVRSNTANVWGSLEMSVHTRVTPWLQGAIYAPVLRRLRRAAGGVTRIQHGYLSGYLYVMLVAIVALLVAAYVH